MHLVHAFRKPARLFEIRLGCFAPDQVAIGRIGNRAGDAGLKTVLDLIETLDGAAGIVIHEGLVALIDVGGQELRGLRIRAGDNKRRHTHDIGRKPRRRQIADMRCRRDQNLAAEMAAFLFRCQLVFIMNTRRTCLDEGLHDFEGVERPAKTGLRISNDRREPGVDRKALALRRLDLVGALQSAVDALGKLRCGIGGIKRLVGYMADAVLASAATCQPER